jgi:tRNA (cmo5U34)-methyltransferase
MDRRGRRGHDWESTDYAAFWVADAEARDPERIEQLRLLANLIPQPHDAPIRVLDLGAGYGIVTNEVLAVFPNARVTLFDLSQAMLDHARPRLAAHASQLDWAIGDLTTPAWVNALRGPYDAVVSAAVLHNLGRGPRIAQIYGELAGLLGPGGAFICYDHLSAGGPLMQRQFASLRGPRPPGNDVARLPAQAAAGHGHDHDGSAAAVATREALAPLRFPGGIEEHLEWLRAAGFAEVDCFWKTLHQALYGGYMATGAV